MSNIGQVAVTLAGAYVGGMVGMPGLGASLGNMLGQALFPTELPTNVGPKITDQKVTTSAIGAAWPWVFGKDAVAGNILWADKLVNHPHEEEAGGKGGPTQKTIYYTATRSYAVGLCRGPIAGITRIWRMEKLVYDVRPRQPEETDDAYAERVAASQGFADGFALHLGTADQMPDPTIEAVKGVGNTPAYRNRAYIVHIDDDLTKTGGSIPGWRYEVVTAGDDATAVVVQYAAAGMGPWSLGEDPRGCQNDHEYRLWGTSESQVIGPTWSSSLNGVLASLADYGIDADRASHSLGWSRDRCRIYAAFAPVPEEQEILYFHFNRHLPDRRLEQQFIPEIPSGGVAACTGFQLLNVPAGLRAWWSGLDDNDAVVLTCTAGIYRVEPLANLESQEQFFNHCTNYPGTPQMCGLTDVIVEVRRKPHLPSPPCNPRCQDAYDLLPENPDYCGIDGRVEHVVGYSVATGSFRALANLRVSGGSVTDYPLGPVVVTGSDGDNQAAWEAAYSAALSAGKRIRPGLVYGVDYPVVPTTAYTRSYQQYALQPDPPTVGSIVRAICQEVGVPSDRIDVSDLTDTLPGYSLATLMTARQGIEPLQAYQFFDCVESDALLKFPKRGKPIVLTLNSDDLGARFAGETAPPLVATNIQQAVELPKFVRVHYKMGAKDYQAGMQQSPPRMTTESVNAKDVQLAISMADDKAAQIAQVIHQDDWWGRETYETSVSPALLQLECADAVAIPIEGQLERVRIVSVNMAPPFSPLKWSLRRDDDGTYVSHAVGASAVPSTDVLGIAGPTQLLLIDGPALDGNADDAGIYVAAWGQFSRWAGAQIMCSIDGGASYKEAVTIVTPATVGRVVGVIAAGPDANVWDYATVITVDMIQGSLESRTQDAVINGANAFFVGADGRWEVLQAMNCTLVGTVDGRARYELTSLLRGRRGTEWAQGLHQAGDSLVFVGPGVARVPREDSVLGKTLKWKAVGLGTIVEAATEHAHLMQGVALEPYSPVHIVAQRQANADIVIRWKRRTRLGGPWLDAVDVPLNEASEAYAITVLSQDGVPLHSASVETPEFRWLAADQAAELGEYPRYILVRVAQKSASVGPGYEGVELIDLGAYVPSGEVSPPPPTRSAQFDFAGDFSASDQFRIQFTQVVSGSQISKAYVLSGAGKSSLADFADELAALIAADFPGMTVTRPASTSVLVATSAGYLNAGHTNSVFNSRVAPMEIRNQARPIQAGGASEIFIDLYEGDELSPDAGGAYAATGGAAASFKVGGLTWAKQKELDAAVGNTGAMSRDFTVNWFVPPGSTPQGALAGLPAQISVTPDLAPYVASASLGQTTSGLNEMKRVAVVLSAKPDYALRRVALAQQGYHPTGYEPRVLPLANGAPVLPAGQKQLVTLSFSVQIVPGVPADGYLVAGQVFWVELDGIRYEFEAAGGDEGQLYFDAAYDALKADIEASGNYTVTKVQGTNNEVSPALYTYYLEIERNVVDTPFTYDAYASYGARLTVTNT